MRSTPRHEAAARPGGYPNMFCQPARYTTIYNAAKSTFRNVSAAKRRAARQDFQPRRFKLLRKSVVHH